MRIWLPYSCVHCSNVSINSVSTDLLLIILTCTRKFQSCKRLFQTNTHIQIYICNLLHVYICTNRWYACTFLHTHIHRYNMQVHLAVCFTWEVISNLSSTSFVYICDFSQDDWVYDIVEHYWDITKFVVQIDNNLRKSYD